MSLTTDPSLSPLQLPMFMFVRNARFSCLGHHGRKPACRDEPKAP